MREYIRLLRIKHYIKNVLIFIPLFFAKEIFCPEKFWRACVGFVCLCLVASSVYILNDLQDVEKDRIHPKKKKRPIASGRISKKTACCIMGICLFLAGFFSWLAFRWDGIGLLILYMMLNIGYSMGLKNKPLVDVVILASGFVLRVIYGSVLTDIAISEWMYLVIMVGSLYMGLGKRRNELKQQKDTREVLKYYTEAFLDKNMYVCLALVIVFYALWTVEVANPYVIWTTPIFMIILMKYSLNIEGDYDGDPVEVLFQDKIMLLLLGLYAIAIFVLIYMT